MKKIVLIFTVTVLFVINNSYTQSLLTGLLKNKQETSEIKQFLLKYKNNNKIPTEIEFTKLLLSMGIVEDFNNSATTKEVAFKLIDFYLNNIEELHLNSKKNLDEVKSVFNSDSYINFRKQIKAINPNANDADIQKVYVEMQEKLKNL